MKWLLLFALLLIMPVHAHIVHNDTQEAESLAAQLAEARNEVDNLRTVNDLRTISPFHLLARGEWSQAILWTIIWIVLLYALYQFILILFARATKEQE